MGIPTAVAFAVLSLNANLAAAIWIVEPEAAEPNRRLLELPMTVRRVRGVTWTPDGSAIVIATEEAVSDIVLFDLATTTR